MRCVRFVKSIGCLLRYMAVLRRCSQCIWHKVSALRIGDLQISAFKLSGSNVQQHRCRASLGLGGSWRRELWRRRHLRVMMFAASIVRFCIGRRRIVHLGY